MSEASVTIDRFKDINYRAIVESDPDVLIVVNREHQIAYLNHILPGFTYEMVIGLSVYAFIPPNFHQTSREAIELVFNGAPSSQYQTNVFIPDGSELWYSTRVIPLVTDGQVKQVVLIATDITERKRAEHALNQSENQYRQILDAIEDFVLVKGEKSRIMWANLAFREYYGMSQEALQGMIDAPFVEPDYTQQYIIDDAKVFNSGERLDIPEEPVTRFDGMVRFFNTVKTPIVDENDKVIMTVGVSRDITERKQQQEERERLIKELQIAKRLADENSRLKSEFLATMSHELRTPLNAIEGFTSIMLQKMGGADYNDSTKRYLSKVQSNSKRLLSLINDFLDLSRIESGRLELVHAPINPPTLVQKWRDEVGILAENKAIGFRVQVQGNLPETIYGDAECISKIALNLLSNAFKFTETGEVSLLVEKRDAYFAIEVKDSGIGIPPHAREYIFDEFRQVDQSSKRKYSGTGLGLAIVQKLCRAMGGTVTLHSEVAIGSTFTVLLPLQTAAQASL